MLPFAPEVLWMLPFAPEARRIGAGGQGPDEAEGDPEGAPARAALVDGRRAWDRPEALGHPEVDRPGMRLDCNAVPRLRCGGHYKSRERCAEATPTMARPHTQCINLHWLTSFASHRGISRETHARATCTILQLCCAEAKAFVR